MADYVLQEKDSAAYVAGDFTGDSWNGNLGVRYVQTKEEITSTTRVVTAQTPGAITHLGIRAVHRRCRWTTPTPTCCRPRISS